MSLLRCHGIDRPVWNRYTEEKASWYYEVTEAGYKYNMPDILAAIGRVQLKRANDLWAERKSIAERYDKAFNENPALSIPPSARGDARHLYPLRINSEKCGRSRDDTIKKLQEDGIGVSVHFIPLHIMPYYKKRYNLRENDFPASLKNFKRVISLPVWPGMNGAQVDRVIAAVQDI
jgi:dTDP-4-amino-4,6-dideoxygalactose transaminase